VADRRRVRERRRARHGGLHILEDEDLVVVPGRARPHVQRRAVDRVDVVAVVDARRPTGDGESLVGGVVEAGAEVSMRASEAEE
jgi:hypothetical protein